MQESFDLIVLAQADREHLCAWRCDGGLIDELVKRGDLLRETEALYYMGRYSEVPPMRELRSSREKRD